MRAYSIVMILAMVAILLGMIVAIPGCPPVPQGATTQPSLTDQLATIALIDAAKIGITSGLSPRLESAYSQGKMPYAAYLTARQEEAAALAALDGLKARELSGQPVTSADIASAESTFIAPLETLVGQYIGQLPATQPAR